jgi:hypothetical protein
MIAGTSSIEPPLATYYYSYYSGFAADDVE